MPSGNFLAVDTSYASRDNAAIVAASGLNPNLSKLSVRYSSDQLRGSRAAGIARGRDLPRRDPTRMQRMCMVHCSDVDVCGIG